MAVSSERRDIRGIHKPARRRRSRSNRRAETHTLNIRYMLVTPDVQDVTLAVPRRFLPDRAIPTAGQRMVTPLAAL